MITIYTRSKFHRQHSRENLISYVSLYSNVVTASVSNVNIVCYGYLTPTTYCMRHWHFAPILYTSLTCCSNVCITSPPHLEQEVVYRLIKHANFNKNCRHVHLCPFSLLVIVLFILILFYIVEKKNDLYIVGYQINIEKHYFSQRSRHRNL